MKYICVLFFVIMCFLILYENTKTDSVFIPFFKKLEESINPIKLEKFRTSKIDSVNVKYREYIYKDFLSMTRDSVQLMQLNNFFNKIELKEENDIRVIYFAFAFHAYLNNKKFTTQDFIKEFPNEVNRINESVAKSELRRKLKTDSIITDNEKKCTIGKIFTIVLPVDNNCTYFSLYPNSLTCKYADDSLQIRVKLLKKEDCSDAKKGHNDLLPICYKLKILSWSNFNYHIANKKYKIGDTISFPINLYERPIKQLK